MRLRSAFLLLIVTVLLITLANAQVGSGTISGTVSDSTGAVLSGAKILIQNQDTGISRSLVADAAGRYTAPSLNPGNYTVTATAEGFQTEERRGVTLAVGQQAVIDMKLQVGAVTESVEVTGEAPLVQTTESTVSYQVSDRAMRDLPLNGRDVSQLILLNPGVTAAQNTPNNSNFVGFAKKYSIGGFRGEDNLFLLDGTFLWDWHHRTPAGPSGALLGLETVKEFQVLTNSVPAQYGRLLGGVFNSVSKSGTNDVHGDIYEFLRNSALDARNFFDGAKPAFRRNQFGATLGGPIKKDKAFFFVAYEGMRQASGITRITNVPDLATRTRSTVSPKVAPYLSLYPLPNGQTFVGGIAQFIFTDPKPISDNFGQARFDYQLGENDSFYGRYTASTSEQTSIPNFPGFSQDTKLSTTLITLSETHIFSPRALNTFRIHLNRVFPIDSGTCPTIAASLLSVPGSPCPPGLIVTGLTSYEGWTNLPNINLTNRFNYSDDFNLTLGAHALQIGAMMERMQFNTNNGNRPFGEWSFTSVAQFLAGTVSRYRGCPPQFCNNIRGERQWFTGFYVEDNWRVNGKLSLNLGVRSEPYSTPSEVNGLNLNLRHILDPSTTPGQLWKNRSWNNIGPRFGFAYSPFASGKTSVRGGFGLLWSASDANAYYFQITRVPPLSPDFDIGDTGHFPDALAELAARTNQGPAYALPYDNNRTAHAMQWNFNIQQQIGSSTMVSIGYVGSRGMDLLSVGDYNIPPLVWDGVSLAVPVGATTRNQNFSTVITFANNADSWYNGLTVSLQRRFAAGLQASVAYTYSKGEAMTETGQTASPVTAGGGDMKAPYDMSAQKGLSGYDFRNVLTVNFSYDLPFAHGKSGFVGRALDGWQLTGIVTAQNGQPLRLAAGVSTALSNASVQARSPNLVLGCKNLTNPQNPNQYINLSCYTAPGVQELGNLGRNTLIGPGLFSWDPGVRKNTPITERVSLEFRAEMFNVLNRANFGVPSNTLYNGTAVPGSAPLGTAGVITSTNTTSRQIQFAMKLLW